ncbi:zinc finger protein 816-like [Culex pipiens pallens]|uniref:zinc finger protein 816-like n=1 Tax=Culex pipiens pallens TaxID=42434 RepID=UPI001953701A|nr:zinc finger protein 816-like [Culex pipiens pallens]
MNLPEVVCRSCLAEFVPLVSLFTMCPNLPDSASDEPADAAPIQLSTLYSELTLIPLDQQFPAEPVSSQICLECVERLKEFYLFRRRAGKSYEELQTKASIARIISQLDTGSSLGSVRNDRLEEDFAEDLIRDDLDKDRFKRPLAAGEQRCEVCMKVFKNRKMLARHQEIHASENKYRCRYCLKWYKARSSWYNHELKHRNAVLKEERLEREFLCEICAKEFKTKKQLNDHLEVVHQGTKRYKCDICNKSFTRNASLAEHKLILHAGINQFSCNICGRAFGKEDSLKTHLSTHLGRRFRCELCNKTFLKRAFLTAHVAKAHPTDEGPKPNECKICHKNFASSSHLKDHLRIHEGSKPEVCRLCGASFRQKQQLKVHMYQHLGKPFKCQFCTAAFGIRVRLMSHLEKNHATEMANMTVVVPEVPMQMPQDIMNEPDFGDGAINEEILNEICYQIDANQIVLQNIEDDGNLIYSSNVFFDDANNLLPDELYDFTKQGYTLPENEENKDS